MNHASTQQLSDGARNSHEPSQELHESAAFLDADPEDVAVTVTLEQRQSYIQVFEAHLVSSGIRLLDGEQSLPAEFERSSRLRLFETRKEDIRLSTRLLVLDPPSLGSTGSKSPFAFWLPLVDVIIQRDEHRVLLSWSDCNQLRARKELINGWRFYDRVYSRDSPNRALSLHFKDSAKAKDFSEAVSFPCKQFFTLHGGGPIKVGSAKIQCQWLLDDAISGQVCHDSEGLQAQCTVQYLRYSGIDGSRSIAIRINSLLASCTSKTSIYWCSSETDFSFPPNEANERFICCLTNLQSTDYISNARRFKSSEHKRRQGVCVSVQPESAPVELIFSCANGESLDIPETRFLDIENVWQLIKLTLLKIEIVSLRQ